MNNDLIERYIYAVTRRMNRKQRDDVAQELRSLVDDMLTERCGSRTPEEKDVRIILTELGTPQELCSQYNEDADKCLIGQPYYTTYKYVMKIVLISVTIGMVFANVVLQMIEPKEWLVMLGTGLSMLYNSYLSSFSIVTLLFAFFCHKGVRITEPFNFDDLPPVPKRSQEISKWESIAGIVFSVIFVVLFVFTPEVFTVGHNGTFISLFDTEAVRETWFIVVAFAACGICREVVQLLEGRYNQKVLTATLVTNAISAVLSIWWLVGFELLNQTFLANMNTIFAGENDIVHLMFGNFDLFFLGVMLFALVVDSIDVTVKTLRK